MKRSVPTFTRRAAGTLAVLACAGITAAAVPASAVTATDWPAYLGGPAHSSYNAADTAITSSGAASLVQKWHVGGGFVSSPVVADGAVYVGSFTGWFYKFIASTGAVAAKVFLGFQPKLTCAPFGFASTATVAVDPSDLQDTVYVAAPDGYLHALSAATLKQKWRSVIAIPSKTVSDYFQWSSPTVANGKIYVGISANCDNPLVRGGVAGYDQATGQRFGTFRTVPQGVVGGSVWSSVAVDSGGDVYATTGNAAPNATKTYYTVSIVKLSPALKPIASFTVPKAERTGDGDFGGSPTLFTATIGGVPTQLVGACNKNGIYYALDRSTMAEVWKQRIGAKSSGKVMAQCQAAAANDGTYLYMAGPATTIGGTAYRGSVERMDPATGAILWQTGLPNGVLTSPTINGGGVIGVGTWDNTTTPNATYLVDASTGAILRTLAQGNDFAQSAFADGWLYTASSTGVYAWGP